MLILCSFADSALQKSIDRLKTQAQEIGMFDATFFYNEKKLDKKFRKKYKDKLIPSRGFGYWCWKPQMILQTLQTMNEGDVLLYMDAGSHLNPRGKKRFEEYLQMLKENPAGILAFQSLGFPEKQMTKMDAFAYFGVADKPEFTDTDQIEATHILIRKCEKSMQFAGEWLQTIDTNFALIDDRPSVLPNFPEFTDHRHDQSLFSLLGKKYQIVQLPNTETYNDDWSQMSEFPLLAKRDKVFHLSFWKKLKRKICGKK